MPSLPSLPLEVLELVIALYEPDGHYYYCGSGQRWLPIESLSKALYTAGRRCIFKVGIGIQRGSAAKEAYSI